MYVCIFYIHIKKDVLSNAFPFWGQCRQKEHDAHDFRDGKSLFLKLVKTFGKNVKFCCRVCTLWKFEIHNFLEFNKEACSSRRVKALCQCLPSFPSCRLYHY